MVKDVEDDIEVVFEVLDDGGLFDEVKLQKLGKLEKLYDGDKVVLFDGLVLGMLLKILNDEFCKQFLIEKSVEGVVVIEVEFGLLVLEKGIVVGDVIVEIVQEFIVIFVDVVVKIILFKQFDWCNVQVMVLNVKGDLCFVVFWLEQ